MDQYGYSQKKIIVSDFHQSKYLNVICRVDVLDSASGDNYYKSNSSVHSKK